MKAGSAYFLLFSFLLGDVSFFISCKSANSYPPLEKQRATLLNKPYFKADRVLDSIQLINDLAFLSSDSCEGRAPGSVGHTRALQRIVERFRNAGVDSFGTSYLQSFNANLINGTSQGYNILGCIKGTKYPNKYVVISAHYDHLGKNDGATFYGASDNASGTACVLAMAEYFKDHPLPYSVVFALFDREETGLEGAYHFTKNLPAPISLPAITMNLNLDMITRSEQHEIFACGVYHQPSFKKLVDAMQGKTTLKILMGHDKGSLQEDWTHQSDHYAFHQKKIPFLYFGVEDHAGYHQPSDTFDKIDLGDYIEVCNLMVILTRLL